MLPVLSSPPIAGAWAERMNSRVDPLEDFENGGPVLDVGSARYDVVWRLSSDGSDVVVDREGVSPRVLFTDTDITEVSLAFNGSMNAHVAYVAGGISKFRWWDTIANAYETTAYTGARSPRCTTDEKNPDYSGDRDIVLTYMRGSTVYVRLQRDRFGVEYAMAPDPESAAFITETTRIVSIGMNTGRRLQWRLE